MKYTFIIILSALICSTAWATEADTVKVVALEEVVATGTKNPTDQRLMPLTVSVVTTEQLEEYHETNILPTLTASVPGLFVTQRGVMGYGVSTGGSGSISVRGIGGSPNTGMLVLIDGLPQYAGLYGHPIADNYQTMMTERVEVIRGPASVFYGSNAMGGVVNIVTRQPKRDTVLTSLHVQGGSFYTLDAGITNRVKCGKFSSAVGFNYSRTDGHRKNMNFDEYNAFVRFGYDFTQNWRLSAMGDVAYFNSSNPGMVSAPIEDNDMHVLRGTASVSVDNEYERTSGAIRIYYNGGHHTIDDGYAEGDAPQAALYNHNDLMAGVSAYQSVSFFRGNRTTFGFDYQHFGGHVWNADKTTGDKTEVIRKTQYELAGYLDFRQQVVSWFSLEAGVRFDWHSQAGLNYIPQAGLSFSIPHNAVLKAMFSRGFRSPTIRELYMYKPANAELEAESMWNYEISYRQTLLEGKLRYGINLFYLHALNMIETRMVDGKPLNMNTGELYNTGVEAEVSYNIIKGLTVGANYSYLHMRNPRLAAPEHKLNVSVNYHHERFRVGTEWQYINGLYLVLPTEGTPASKENFLLWNAHADLRIWRELWAYVKADNLLAQEYEINVGFPMPRTTLMGGLSWSF
ncbi:MAG: TonB-dependent receptor [Paludibacteraceae bacterium]|nr:TonB-dependent receptor [Paludibacteraceae bacterium]